MKVPTGRHIMIPGETEIVAVSGRHPEYRPVAIAETITHHHVRHLARWPIGTSYVTVAGDTIALLNQLLTMQRADDEQEHNRAPHGTEWFDTAPPIFGVDHTGVGIAVVDIFRSHPVPVPMIAITITSGTASRGRQQEDSYRSWTVPKAELIGPMLVGIQNQTLKIAPGIDHASALDQEMQAFRAKMRPGGNVSYEALAEKMHDDLVLAVAIATWVAHRIDANPAGVYR